MNTDRKILKDIPITFCIFLCVLLAGCDNDCPTCFKSEKVFITLSSSHSVSKGNFEIIHILVTDNGGRPLAGKRVEWEIIEGEGILSETRSHTDETGNAYSGVYWSQPGIIKIKAVVQGNVTSDTITLEVGD